MATLANITRWIGTSLQGPAPALLDNALDTRIHLMMETWGFEENFWIHLCSNLTRTTGPDSDSEAF